MCKYDTMSFRNSISYIKLKMLRDVYFFNKNLINEYPTYNHYESVLDNNGNGSYDDQSFNAKNYAGLYKNFVNIISKVVDLDKLFGSDPLSKFDNVEPSDDMIKVISMIRTFERIEKYRSRGITSFEYNGEDY